MYIKNVVRMAEITNTNKRFHQLYFTYFVADEEKVYTKVGLLAIITKILVCL